MRVPSPNPPATQLLPVPAEEDLGAACSAGVRVDTLPGDLDRVIIFILSSVRFEPTEVANREPKKERGRVGKAFRGGLLGVMSS